MSKLSKFSLKKPEDCSSDSCLSGYSFVFLLSLPELLEWPYILLVILIPTVVSLSVLAAYLVKKRKRKAQTVQQVKNAALKPKPKALSITNFELSSNAVKFYVQKGLVKKRLVMVKEIPINEIASIEKFGAKLSVSWRNAVDMFVMQKKADSFGDLTEKVKALIEEQKITVETMEKAKVRRQELAVLVNSSLEVADLAFDILISLQEKRVNWNRLEEAFSGFGGNRNFLGQTMEPLNFDFSKLSLAIKKQHPKSTSKETYNILKTAHLYFKGLNLKDDFPEVHPNYQDAKALIFSYYLLNDLLLGKVVGDEEVEKESIELELALQSLATDANVEVNFDALKDSLNRMDIWQEREGAIEESRDIFKEQMKQLLTVELES